MPIYEYRCADCGHELEAIQKFSDEPLTECPACGSSGLRRKISAAAFRLKGGGWYETDFKKDKRRNVVADGDGSGGKPASGSDGGSDKPAAAATPASTDTAKTSTGGGGSAGAGTAGTGSSAGRTA